MSLLVIFTEEGPLLDFFTILIEYKNSEGEVITKMDYNWKFVILGIILANGVITILYEKYALDCLVDLFERIFLKTKSKVESTNIASVTLKDT